MKETPPKQPRPGFGLSRCPIIPERRRRIEGGFAFIEHRFLHRGFFACLQADELVLYFLLVLAADRHGVSFYGSEALCSLCQLSPERYQQARNALIAKDLVAYDGRRFQVLSLPDRVADHRSLPLICEDDFEAHDPDTIRRAIRASLHVSANEAANEQ